MTFAHLTCCRCIAAMFHILVFSSCRMCDNVLCVNLSTAVSGNLTAVVVAGPLLTSSRMHESRPTLADLRGSLSPGMIVTSLSWNLSRFSLAFMFWIQRMLLKKWQKNHQYLEVKLLECECLQFDFFYLKVHSIQMTSITCISVCILSCVCNKQHFSV